MTRSRSISLKSLGVCEEDHDKNQARDSKQVALEYKQPGCSWVVYRGMT